MQCLTKVTKQSAYTGELPLNLMYVIQYLAQAFESAICKNGLILRSNLKTYLGHIYIYTGDRPFKCKVYEQKKMPYMKIQKWKGR